MPRKKKEEKVKINNKESKKKEAMGASLVGSKGHTGTVISGGVIEYDYNNTFDDIQTSIDTIKRMENDGSIRTSLSLVELPLLSKITDIIPASDDKLDIEKRDFIADQIIGETSVSTSYSYRDHIDESSKFARYGVMPFEIVCKEGIWNNPKYAPSNKILLKKLAVRPPETIEKWVVNKTEGDGLDGIIQTPPSGDYALEGYEEKLIDIYKMIMYIHGRVGNNWKGVSILRPIYKHWKYKDSIYKIEAIGLQRNACGLPVLYLSNPDDEKIELAHKILRSIQVHEEIGLALNKDKESFEFHNGGIETIAIQRAIAHHDSKIYQNVIAGFMLLGQEGRGGSRALGSSLIDFYMMLIESYVRIQDDAMNRYLIPKLINSNYYDYTHYPRALSRIGRIAEKESLANILSILTNINVLQNELPLKKYVHEIYGLPFVEKIAEESQEEDKEVIDEKNEKISKKKPAAKKEDKKIENSFEVSVNGIYKFENVKTDEKFRDKWLMVTNKLNEMQKKSLSDQALKLMKKGIVPNINYIEVPYREVTYNLVKDYVTELESKNPNFSVGKNDVENIVNIYENDAKCSIAKAIMSLANKAETLGTDKKIIL